jgi:hypothetical protein
LQAPLTLTLSPSDGAREQGSPRWDKSLNGELFHQTSGRSGKLNSLNRAELHAFDL